MSLFLKLFDTTAQYNAYTADTANFVKPNVSFIEETNGVSYHQYDFYDRYLTFIAKEQGTFKLTIGSAVPTSILSSVSYSTDDGETWTTTNNVNDQTVTITTPTVNIGDKVLWKGTGTAMSVITSSTAAANRPASSSIFSSTGTFDAEGNILSLVWGDNFADKDYVAEGSSYNFACMFYANTGHVGNDYARIVSAKNMCMPIRNVPTGCYFRMFQESTGATANNTLVIGPSVIATESVGAGACEYMFYQCTSLTTAPELPATTLAERCYRMMFYRCSSLTTAPELPATTLAERCFETMFYECSSLTKAPSSIGASSTIMAPSGCTNMFYRCSSLTTVPKLPTTNLSGATYCYAYMFVDCTSLTTPPDLPATTLADECYRSMFNDCTSLTTAPELPATTMAASAYTAMFQNCTSLTTAPELPATTLAENSYLWMFHSCTSLTTAPELPATTLADYCYAYMFVDCTSLTTPPDLPATTLVYGCYYGMFQNCTSLTTAPDLPATTLASSCYNGMFQNCTSLSAITCLATDISVTDCTTNWVNDVAANGTFTKAASMSDWTTGANGIPSGWSVQDAT